MNINDLGAMAVYRFPSHLVAPHRTHSTSLIAPLEVRVLQGPIFRTKKLLFTTSAQSQNFPLF